MKLNIKNLKQLKKSATKLEKCCINYVLDKWKEYDDKTQIFTDVLYHGCQTGCVCFLIYTNDCVEFYQKYQKEIDKLLYEIIFETGIYNLKEIFKVWDEEDPLGREETNQTLLAWFGFEETLRDIGVNFEELEKKI